MAKRRKKTGSWEVSDTRAEKLFPETGFLADYLEYIREANDAPLFYHLGSILTVMCTLTGDRDLKVIREDKRIRYVPIQMWSAMVGGSGDRKSSAMEPAKRLGDLANGDRMLSTAASAEAWHQELAQPEVGGVGMVHYDELSRLFDLRHKTYNRGMNGWLLNAWSGGPLTHRVVQEVDQPRNKYPPIPRVRFSILGAIPPDVLSRNTSREDWRAGLLPRFTFWGARRKGWVGLDGYDEVTENKLANWLQDVCCDEADIYISPRVARVITEWCYYHTEVGRERHDDDSQAILQRLRDKGFVFAAMYAISDLEVGARTRLRVQSIHAARACDLLTTLKRSTLNLFKLVGASVEVKKEMEVITHIRKHPWCDINSICEATGLSRREVTPIIANMANDDIIETEQRRSEKKRGPTPFCFKAK